GVVAPPLPDLFGEHDLAGGGLGLEPRGEVHRLAEVVEDAIGLYRITGAAVDADLERTARGFPVRFAEGGPGRLERGRGGETIALAIEDGHDRVADRLHHRAPVLGDHALDELEMVLHDGEGARVADAAVELRGA